ncbi:MAG: diphthamide synthesis protein [Nanobdellota archaeon]
MEVDLEVERAISKIKDSKSAKVLIQLPEGLKSSAELIRDRINSEVDVEIYIWAGTCFGACDVPCGLEKLGIDLVIQWGHSEWVS